VVACLIQKGASLEVPDTDGDTALWWAARWGQVETTAIPLHYGAKISSSILQVARSQSHLEVSRILESQKRGLSKYPNRV
jgi:ankyrin repeat protein